MRRVVLARSAGFCSGVRRAVMMALKAARRHRTVHTIGELIHNHQVVDVLRKYGVVLCDDVSALRSGDTVLVRSHGIERSLREELERRGVRLIDCTCPKVKRIHSIIRHHAMKGERIVIFGDRGHPEVEALCSEVPDAILVSSIKEIDKIPSDGRCICLVAQSTQSRVGFERLADELRRKFEEVRVFDTICSSTTERQEELCRLLMDADAVVVVGGKHSANTKRLVEIAEDAGRTTYHIETADEIEEGLSRHRRIVVTAGASTPVWVIKDVMRKIEKIVGERKPLFERVLSALIRGNLLAAVSAAALTLISFILLRLPLDAALMSVAALYVFCVHTANQLIAFQKEVFQKATQSIFIFRGLLAAVAALIAFVIILQYGALPTLLFAVAVVAGVFYGVETLPTRLMLRSLRDIPGSKEIFCAVGWAFVASILPLTAYRVTPPYHIVLAAFMLALFPVYLRSTLFDIRRIERDRLMGREVTVLALGSQSTRRVLGVVLAGWVSVVVLTGVFRIFGTPVYYTLLMPTTFAVSLLLRRLNLLQRESLFEVVLDAGIVVTALLLLLCSFQ